MSKLTLPIVYFVHCLCHFMSRGSEQFELFARTRYEVVDATLNSEPAFYIPTSSEAAALYINIPRCIEWEHTFRTLWKLLILFSYFLGLYVL